MGQRLLDKLQLGEGELTLNVGSYIDSAEHGNKALDHLAGTLGDNVAKGFNNPVQNIASGLGVIATGGWGLGLKAGGALGGGISRVRTKRRTRENAKKVIKGMVFARPVVTLEPAEKLLLHSYAAMSAMGHGHAEAVLQGLIATVVWGGDKGAIKGSNYAMKDPALQAQCERIARELLAYLFGGDEKAYQEYVQQQLEEVRGYLENRLPWLYEEIFFQGARWGRVHLEEV